MKIAAHTQPEDIYRIATRVGDLESNLPLVGDRIFYASVRGNDANDGLSWGTAKKTLSGAVIALGGTKGFIQLGYGSITSAPVVLPSYTVIQGLGGATGGAAALTTVTFSATGAGSLIDLGSTAGVRLRDFQLLYSNAGFTGRCVDARNTTGSDPAYFDIDGLYIGGVAVDGGIGVSVDKAIDGTIRNCVIIGNQYGILGRSAVGTYSNRISVQNCSFNRNAVRHISNIGEAWSILGNTFEPITAGGAAGAIVNDAVVTATGFIISGNWFGDITAAAGGTQIGVGGSGFTIVGNQIGFNDGATGITVAAASTGFFIRGNRFVSAGASTGMNLGAGCVGFDVTANEYSGVTTKLTGVTSSFWLRPAIDAVDTYRIDNVGGSAYFLINTNNGRIGLLSSAPASTVQIGGSLQLPFNAVAVDTTLNINHRYISVDASGGARTITLPSANAIAGRAYEIIKNDASVNAVTIATTAAQTINGAATTALPLQWNKVKVVSNGFDWVIF